MSSLERLRPEDQCSCEISWSMEQGLGWLRLHKRPYRKKESKSKQKKFFLAFFLLVFHLGLLVSFTFIICKHLHLLEKHNYIQRRAQRAPFFLVSSACSFLTIPTALGNLSPTHSFLSFPSFFSFVKATSSAYHKLYLRCFSSFYSFIH